MRRLLNASLLLASSFTDEEEGKLERLVSGDFVATPSSDFHWSARDSQGLQHPEKASVIAHEP